MTTSEYDQALWFLTTII